MRPRLLLLALALSVAGCGGEERVPVVAQPVEGRELGRELAEGGLVLYVRAPDGAVQDSDREHAERIDAGLTALDAVPERVLSGPAPALPYAQEAFRTATPTGALAPLRPADGHAAVGRTAGAALKLLTAAQPAGSTRALVGHGGTLEVIAGVRLAEGATAVFRPDGAGEVLLVGVVDPGDWDDVRP